MYTIIIVVFYKTAINKSAIILSSCMYVCSYTCCGIKFRSTTASQFYNLLDQQLNVVTSKLHDGAIPAGWQVQHLFVECVNKQQHI